MPSSCRINYAFANYKHKMYFFGGINEKNEVLDTMDEFDAMTYKFNAVKYRLDTKPTSR